MQLKRLPIGTVLLFGLLLAWEPAVATVSNSYSTSFPNTEAPISEGGNWLNGKANGLDWQNVNSMPGLAYGTQSGTSNPPYDDSTAVLNGTFGPDQQASATVIDNDAGGNWYAEVELRLRTTVTAHSITGYEINFSANRNNNYCTIVRWNGPLATGEGQGFTSLNYNGQCGGIKTGDVVSARIVGSTITAWINGTQVIQATDSTYTNGTPGVGFYLQNLSQAGDPTRYGFSQFSASTVGTSATATPTTSAPTATASPAATATPTTTCYVDAVLNGAQHKFTRPASFCTNQ